VLGHDHIFFLLGLQTSRRQLIAEVSELHSHNVELCVFVPRRSRILKGLLCKQRVEGNTSRRRGTVTLHLLDGAQIDISEILQGKTNKPCRHTLDLAAVDYSSQCWRLDYATAEYYRPQSIKKYTTRCRK